MSKTAIITLGMIIGFSLAVGIVLGNEFVSNFSYGVVCTMAAIGFLAGGSL